MDDYSETINAYGKYGQSREVSIEQLYQAFKLRLINDLMTEIYPSKDVGRLVNTSEINAQGKAVRG